MITALAYGLTAGVLAVWPATILFVCAVLWREFH